MAIICGLLEAPEHPPSARLPCATRSRDASCSAPDRWRAWADSEGCAVVSGPCTKTARYCRSKKRHGAAMSGLNVSEKHERTRQARERTGLTQLAGGVPSRVATRMTRPPIGVGDCFGELRVESFYEYRNGRNKVWLCRCDCGRAAIRTGSGLARSRSLGYISACDQCIHELRCGATIERRSMRHEALLRLWSRSGTLWSQEAVERIEDDIRTEVGRELGGWEDEPAPSMYVDLTMYEDPRSGADADDEATAWHPCLPSHPDHIQRTRQAALDAAVERVKSDGAKRAPKSNWIRWFAE